jgi:2-oxoisovalerate dehydrogenase E1 component alpha subunit
VADRAASYGFPGVVVDGNDVLACFAAMRTAHERARAGDGPTLVECKTYRFLGHTSDDDDKTYRTRDEVAEARHDDPIERFATYLGEHQILDAVASDTIRAEVKSRIEDAIAAAWEAEDPLPGSAMRHVFAEDGDPRPTGRPHD